MTLSTPVELLLKNLKETTIQISQLDLDEEADESLLLSLQNNQVELRQKIEEKLKQEGRTFNEHEKQYISECLILEQQNIENFNIKKQFLSEQIQRIYSGKISRDLYQHEEEPSQGFFIDKHR